MLKKKKKVSLVVTQRLSVVGRFNLGKYSGTGSHAQNTKGQVTYQEVTVIPFLHYVRAHEALAHTGCDVDECVRRAPGHVCIPEQGPVSEPEAHWPSQQRVTLQVQSQPQERTARTPQSSPLNHTRVLRRHSNVCSAFSGVRDVAAHVRESSPTPF